MVAASAAVPNRLKWFISRFTTNSSVDGMPNAGSPSDSAPSAPIVIIVWKNRPAFSSRVIWLRRLSTRSAIGSDASR